MIENFDFGAAMTAISVVLMAWIAFQFYWKPRREDRWRRELDNHKDRTETIQQLSNDKIWVQYKNDLSTFLDKGDRFFGLSWWRIYDQCLLVAFVYPLVLFLFSWAFGGNGSLGEANLLPDSLSWLGRLGYMIFLSFLFFFIFFWTKNSDKIAHRSIQYLPSPFAAQVRKRRWLLHILEVVSLFVGLLIVMGFANAVAVAVAVVGAVVGIGVGAVAVAVAVAFAVAVSDTNTPFLSLLFLVFFVALPLVNALADSLSWMATRFFVKRAEER